MGNTILDERYKELLRQVYEILKPLGYKKEASNFRQIYKGGLGKILNFQKSKWNTNNEIQFVLNAGVYFEKENVIQNFRFKESECQIRKRVNGNDSWWVINESTDMEKLYESVKNSLSMILDLFSVFTDKETTIELILNEKANSYSDITIMHYRNAKLLTDMGYAREVYELIKDSNAKFLAELAKEISLTFTRQM